MKKKQLDYDPLVYIKKVRSYCYRNDMTLKALAKLLPIDYCYFCLIVTGKRPFSERLRWKINNLLENEKEN